MHESERYFYEAISAMIDDGLEESDRGDLLTPEEAQRLRDAVKADFSRCAQLMRR